MSLVVRPLAAEEIGARAVDVTAVATAIELAGGPKLRPWWLRHRGHGQWIVAGDDPEAPADLRGRVVARSTNANRIHPELVRGHALGYGYAEPAR